MLVGAMLLAANTTVAFVPLSVVAVLKLIVPVRRWRNRCSLILARIGESWVGFNNLCLRTLTRTRWEIAGGEGLSRGGRYMVICNHQSWVDIPVLQYVLTGRIPLLRFFLKQELIWVPLLGFAWWALDFPFMKRYGRRKLEKHPELRGRDLDTTRRACEKFRDIPVSIMNFLEGTRFTSAKHEREGGGGYAHLLPPRSGGLAFVLGAMGAHLDCILDVTIVYPAGRPTITDLFSNRLPLVKTVIRERRIPPEFTTGGYAEDEAFRGRFQAWVSEMWADKDRLIAESLAAA